MSNCELDWDITLRILCRLRGQLARLIAVSIWDYCCRSRGQIARLIGVSIWAYCGRLRCWIARLIGVSIWDSCVGRDVKLQGWSGCLLRVIVEVGRPNCKIDWVARLRILCRSRGQSARVLGMPMWDYCVGREVKLQGWLCCPCEFLV